MAMRFESYDFYRLQGVAPNQTQQPLNQNGSSESQLVAHFTGKTVAITGTFTATAQVEGSMDGSNWFPVDSSVTAPALIETTASFRFMRVTISGYASGAVEATFGGFNTRVAH